MKKKGKGRNAGYFRGGDVLRIHTCLYWVFLKGGIKAQAQARREGGGFTKFSRRHSGFVFSGFDLVVYF